MSLGLCVWGRGARFWCAGWVRVETYMNSSSVPVEWSSPGNGVVAVSYNCKRGLVLVVARKG